MELGLQKKSIVRIKRHMHMPYIQIFQLLRAILNNYRRKEIIYHKISSNPLDFRRNKLKKKKN